MTLPLDPTVRRKSKRLAQRLAFTTRRLQSLQIPAGADRVWVYDTEAPRLGFMKTAGGASAFYYLGRMAGRPRRYRVGDGSISIDAARKIAREVMVEVGKGVDVHAKRKDARREETFGQAFEYFMEHHSRGGIKRSWKDDEERHDKYLKHFDARHLSSITYDDINSLIAKIGKKQPRLANRVLSLISVVYKKNCRREGLEHISNPAAKVDRFDEVERERRLEISELPRFFEAVEKASPDMRDFFLLSLYTGARSSNTRSLEWRELNLDDGVWIIPPEKFKTKKPLTVPLAEAAIEILKRRRADQQQRGRYVFPADSKAGHMAEPKNSWKRVCRIAKLDGLHVHDLRRTLGSFQADSGSSTLTIGKSLGHQSQKATSIYARISLKPVRASVEGAVQAMLAAKEKKLAAESPPGAK